MMFAYIIKSSLLLALLYGSFALLLSRETFHRFNRIALLGVLVVSMVLPFVQLTIQKPEFLSYEEVPTQFVSDIVSVEPELPQAQPVEPIEQEAIASPASRISMEQILWWLYLCGLVASLAIFFLQLFRLWQETGGGVRTKDEFGNTVVIRGGDFAPYSFLHYIIISVSDYEHLRRPILHATRSRNRRPRPSCCRP